MGIFTQKTEYNLNKYLSPDSFAKLPELIYKYTDLDYSYQKKNEGCSLYPLFDNMSRRNAFVPEIDITVSAEDYPYVVRISGRPVKIVRGFMLLWFVFSLFGELLVIADIFTSESYNLLTLLGPVTLCVLGFAVCRLFTKACFDAVVKVIKNEFLR